MNPNDWNQAGNTNPDPNLSTPHDMNPNQTVATPIQNSSWNDSDPNTGVAYPAPQGNLEPLPPMPDQGMMNSSMPQGDFTDVVPRDPNVLNFMASAVVEKHGQTVDQTFLKTESERLYDEFGEKLVDYFEPMLSKDQIEQFDNLMNQGSTQDQLLAFLMSCIPDLTTQIEKVLIEYKEKYIFGF